MAFQLKLNKLEKTELDASLRNKSEKYEELVEEVKHSRYVQRTRDCAWKPRKGSGATRNRWFDRCTLAVCFRDLLQDKQEELDATQSQAHWIVLQQEAIIADTAKQLAEISDLVNDLLWTFNKESSLEQV